MWGCGGSLDRLTRPSLKGGKTTVLWLALGMALLASAGAEPEHGAAAVEAARAQPIDLSVDRARSRNYLPPALQIGAFELLLNRFDNRFIGDDFAVSRRSIRRHLRNS